MTDSKIADDAVEQLQAFGLKTYEAECFVALSRVPQATAREISEIADVPRTRVYDAVGTLESRGLVSIQHANPQIFRAVALQDAIETLRRAYESRLQSIHQSLDAIEPATPDDPEDPEIKVGTLSGQKAIGARTERLLAEADEEVWLVVDGAVCNSSLLESIEVAVGRELRTHIVIAGNGVDAEALPDEVVVEPSAERLSTLGLAVRDSGTIPTTERTVTRLMVVDNEEALVGTDTTETHPEVDEQSVYAVGETNGLVVVTRNLLTSQLPTEADN